MNAAEFSQHLNGVGVAVEGVFIGWGIVFLWREKSRRQLTLFSLFCRTPPVMAFAFSVLLFDSGVWFRAALIWTWRRFNDSGPFEVYQIVGLQIGAFLIVIGGLMKIRSVTYPDWGNMPWMMCGVVSTVLFFLI